MTNPVFVTVKALLAAPAVSAAVSDRVWPVVATQETQAAHILVNQINLVDPMLLKGHSGLEEARVTIECRGRTATETIKLGDAVKLALEPIHRQVIDGVPTSFRKEGTDVTEYADNSSFHRRIIDFYVRLH